MSENINDDLEEGEIADDDTEPVFIKEIKRLPRRYDLNEGKVISRHKKNCRHASHKQDKIKEIGKKWKFHRKHHKSCHKHIELRHSKFETNSIPFKNSPSIGLNGRKHNYKYPKIPLSKCAFKNYTSPPRKALKSENLNSPNGPLKNIYEFPKLLPDYEITHDDKTNLSANSSGKEPRETLSNISNENDSSNLSLTPSVLEIPVNKSDDEDEEELRRLALATCLKRQALSQELKQSNFSKDINFVSNGPGITEDNYEVVDMDVGNSDTENIVEENGLYVIDTTPSQLGEVQSSNISFVPVNTNNYVGNGFLFPKNSDKPVQSFTSDTFGPEFSNSFYSNFEAVNKDSPLPCSQLDEDFEEELLRAELLASMNSVRKQSQDNLAKAECANKIIPFNKGNELLKHDVTSEERIVSIKSDFNSTNKQMNNFSEKRYINNKANYNITDYERSINFKNDIPFQNERTVSIINVGPEKKVFNEKARSVTAVYPKSNFSVTNPTVVKKLDLKVKLNNVSPNPNILPPITLPQERIVISLNNESSSDDSDEEDNTLNKLPEEIPAVASLEALIANARHESDGKNDSASNSLDAVSWLSKAQQEEYNSLKKILDAKKSLQTQKKNQNNAGNNGLNLLKKKLLIAQRNLDKEKELMSSTTKELIRKKRAYMVSKLRIHQLKEQLSAAEKVRISNLQSWTKCSSNLQTLKKSVSKREAMIKSLQSKINSYFPELPTSSFLSNHIVDHNYIQL